MAQRYFNIDKDATPITVNNALRAVSGFSGCNTKWSGMEAALGLEVVKKSLDDDEVRQWLDGGNVCFAEVEPESYLHFVLVTGHTEGRFHMLDPYKNVEGWLDEYYPGVESWRLIHPFEPSPPPPPVETLNLIDPHLQTAIPGVLAAHAVEGRPALMRKILSLYYAWRYSRPAHAKAQDEVREVAFKYVRDAKPAACKVFSFEDVFGVLRANLYTKPIVRHYTNDYGGIIDVDSALGAKRWVDLFRDALHATSERILQDFPNLPSPVFLMESPNELYPSNDPPLVTRAANLDDAIALEVERTGLPIATVGYCAGVGNPHESEYHLLVPLARTLERTGGGMGLHSYWWANRRGQNGLESWWRWHAGRYQWVDKVLVEHGIHVNWYCGESGVVQSDDGHTLNAHSGWKDVMAWEQYLSDLLLVNEWDNEWNAAHGGRMKARCVFTSSAPFCGWASFQVQQREWEAIAAALG